MLTSESHSLAAVNAPGQQGHSAARDRAPVSLSASSSGVGLVFVLSPVGSSSVSHRRGKVLMQATLITVTRAHDLNWHIYCAHRSTVVTIPVAHHDLPQER